MSPIKIEVSDETKKVVENVDDNDDEVDNNDGFLHDSSSDFDDKISKQHDDDSNIKEVAPPMHIKKPTATKPSFK